MVSEPPLVSRDTYPSAASLALAVTRQLRDHLSAQDPLPALDRREAVFMFIGVMPGKVWLWEADTYPVQEIGPIELPESITAQLDCNWLALMEVGRARGGWRILAVESMHCPLGNVDDVRARPVKKPGRAAAQKKSKVHTETSSLDRLAPRLKSTTTKAPAWKFTSTLRARVFSWRSSALAAKRLKEAVAEVKQAAKEDDQRAADGAVLIVSKIEPAFEQVDSSSGALGTAVSNAIEELAPIIAAGSAEAKTHRKRLERLYQALQDSEYGYLEGLGDEWGLICGTPEVAAEWVDFLVPTLELVWGKPNSGYFAGTSACLSALLAAGQYQRILDLLALNPRSQIWHYRRYGVEALKMMGRPDEALTMARQHCINDSHGRIGVTCEELLISMGREDEAYQEYGLHLRRASTYKASFSALCKRYPARDPKLMLRDLVGASPEPGAWFTAAVSLGELEIAAEVAPVAKDPRTLTRAAKAQLVKHPIFAFRVALAALESIDTGAGYDITSADVHAAFEVLKKAAEVTGNQKALETWLAAVAKRTDVSFVRRVLMKYC